MSVRLAALIAWLLTASIGAYMLRTWVARGGLGRQRATGVGVPPGVVFGHAGAALTGLAVWIGFVASGLRPLAWIGVVIVSTAVTLGICTVTIWTPYPVLADPDLESEEPQGFGDRRTPAPPAEHHDAFTVTDEMIASLLADAEPFPARRRNRGHLLPLIPAMHGLLAMATFLLSVWSAALSARLA